MLPEEQSSQLFRWNLLIKACIFALNFLKSCTTLPSYVCRCWKSNAKLIFFILLLARRPMVLFIFNISFTRLYFNFPSYTVVGFFSVYIQFIFLFLSEKLPWILNNVFCYFSEELNLFVCWMLFASILYHELSSFFFSLAFLMFLHYVPYCAFGYISLPLFISVI